MTEPAVKLNNKFQYKDYKNWNDNERWELIDGEAYSMAPAPTRTHQSISIKIASIIWNYLEGKKCQIFSAPFDVILYDEKEKSDDSINVVQPDILVVCDENKLKERGCFGSPDMVIEIVSPSTARKDMKDKLAVYEKFGVKEYWIVLPYEKSVIVYKYNEETKKYNENDVYEENESIKVSIFEDLEIQLNKIFEGI